MNGAALLDDSSLAPPLTHRTAANGRCWRKRICAEGRQLCADDRWHWHYW